MKPMKIDELCQIIDGELLCGDRETVITGTSVTSKEGDAATLFVPTIGERVDAHNFIGDAYNTGMRVTLTSKREIIEQFGEVTKKNTDALTVILVKDTLQALQKLATVYRSRFMIPLIGITGSVGKTTTKEMVAAALAGRYKLLKTAGNKNSQIGLSQMMLALDETYELAVIEMGISLEKEMEKLVAIARPECALITNIGVSHIGQMGSKENIVREKLDIVCQMEEGSKLLVCGDDPMLLPLKTNPDSVLMNEKTAAIVKTMNVLTYGIEETNDFYAKNIRQSNDGTTFTFCIGDKAKALLQRDTHNNDKEISAECEAELQVLGSHNVKNAVAALGMALLYNVEQKIAVDGLRAYRPISMRGGIETCGSLTMIDDTYNASPDSMKSSLDVLDQYRTIGRKLVVFGDILELGTVSRDCHREVGLYAAKKNLNILITVGKEAGHIAEAVKEQAGDSIEVISCATNEEVKKILSDILQKQDCILLKASRGMQLETVAKWLRESGGVFN